MNGDEDYFVSLADLYFEEGISAGALATAIEKHGICGWDRFDRYEHFGPAAAETKQALDRLAHQHKTDTDPRPVDDSEDLDPASDLLYFLGWKGSERPDFATGTAVLKPPDRRRADDAKIEKTELTIIGALLYVVEGKANCARHPKFRTTEELIAHMVQNFDGIRGLGKRTLEQRFAAGRALIDKPG